MRALPKSLTSLILTTAVASANDLRFDYGKSLYYRETGIQRVGNTSKPIYEYYTKDKRGYYQPVTDSAKHGAPSRETDPVRNFEPKVEAPPATASSQCGQMMGKIYEHLNTYLNTLRSELARMRSEYEQDNDQTAASRQSDPRNAPKPKMNYALYNEVLAQVNALQSSRVPMDKGRLHPENFQSRDPNWIASVGNYEFASKGTQVSNAPVPARKDGQRLANFLCGEGNERTFRVRDMDGIASNRHATFTLPPEIIYLEDRLMLLRQTVSNMMKNAPELGKRTPQGTVYKSIEYPFNMHGARAPVAPMKGPYAVRDMMLVGIGHLESWIGSVKTSGMTGNVYKAQISRADLYPDPRAIRLQVKR